MSKKLYPLIEREVRIAWNGGNLWMPIIFFISIAILYPFAVGPDAKILAITGGGVLWIAALLAALLPMERLILPDRENGFLDQLTVRGYSDEWIALAKIIGHWCAFGPPLVIASIFAAILIGQGDDKIGLIIMGLLIGTPALAGLGVTISALTAGLNGAAAIGGLLLLPLAIPILIFGAATTSPDPGSALQLLAAASLAMTVISPFAAGAALRALRE